MYGWCGAIQMAEAAARIITWHSGPDMQNMLMKSEEEKLTKWAAEGETVRLVLKAASR